MRLDRCVFTIYMYDRFHCKIWPVCVYLDMILYNRFHCETWPVCVYYIHDVVWPIPLWDLIGLCVRYTCMAEYWRLCHWPIYWHSPMQSRDHSSKQVGGWETIPKSLRKKPSFSNLELEPFPPPQERNVTRSATLSTTLLFWFISVCISIYLYTFQFTKEMIS